MAAAACVGSLVPAFKVNALANASDLMLAS